MLAVIEPKQDALVADKISQTIHRRPLWNVRRSKGGADMIGERVWLCQRGKISPADFVGRYHLIIARELLSQACLANAPRTSECQQSCLAKRRPQQRQVALTPKEWW
jgi:hypothetical protein